MSSRKVGAKPEAELVFLVNRRDRLFRP